MAQLQVVEERTAADVAEEYLEWRELARETQDKANKLRAELLKFAEREHTDALREGSVTKPKFGEASVSYVGRFRALSPVDEALLETSIGEHYDHVVDRVETIGLRSGITLEVLEAIVGESKMARLTPLLEVKSASKLNKTTYSVVASLFGAGQTNAAETLLSTARRLAYEPHVKGSK